MILQTHAPSRVLNLLQSEYETEAWLQYQSEKEPNWIFSSNHAVLSQSCALAVNNIERAWSLWCKMTAHASMFIYTTHFVNALLMFNSHEPIIDNFCLPGYLAGTIYCSSGAAYTAE